MHTLLKCWIICFEQTLVLSATILDHANVTQKYIGKLPKTGNKIIIYCFGVMKCMVEMDIKNRFGVETGVGKRT